MAGPAIYNFGRGGPRTREIFSANRRSSPRDPDPPPRPVSGDGEPRKGEGRDPEPVPGRRVLAGGRRTRGRVLLRRAPPRADPCAENSGLRPGPPPPWDRGLPHPGHSEQAGRLRGAGELLRGLPPRRHRGPDRGRGPGGPHRCDRGEHDPPAAGTAPVITRRTRTAGSGTGRSRTPPRPRRTAGTGIPPGTSRTRAAAWRGHTRAGPADGTGGVGVGSAIVSGAPEISTSAGSWAWAILAGARCAPA